MKRLRSIILIAAWIGLAWLVFRAAGNNEMSDIFWVNIVYTAFLIAFALFIVVAVATFLNRRLHPPVAVVIAASIFLILGVAAIDVFWLRDFIASRLS